MTDAVTPLSPDDPRASRPIYTINEAAHYLGTPYETMRRWVRPPDEGESLVAAFPKDGHRPVLPFVGLAEALVLSIAYRGGMRSDRIAEGVAGIKKTFGKRGIEYVLASKLLYHDKTELLLAEPGKELRNLMVARTRQMQMTDAVKNQLSPISYGEDGFAERIVLPIFKTRVVADAREAFGHPFVERTGTRVQDVLDLFWAEEDIGDIAYDFELTTDEVEDLIRAQTKPTARWAESGVLQ